MAQSVFPPQTRPACPPSRPRSEAPARQAVHGRPVRGGASSDNPPDDRAIGFGDQNIDPKHRTRRANRHGLIPPSDRQSFPGTPAAAGADVPVKGSPCGRKNAARSMRNNALSTIQITSTFKCQAAESRVITGNISLRRRCRRASGIRAQVVKWRLAAHKLVHAIPSLCPTGPVRCLRIKAPSTSLVASARRLRPPTRTGPPENCPEAENYPGLLLGPLGRHAACKPLYILRASLGLVAPTEPSRPSSLARYLHSPSRMFHSLGSVC